MIAASLAASVGCLRHCPVVLFMSSSGTGAPPPHHPQAGGVLVWLFWLAVAGLVSWWVAWARRRPEGLGLRLNRRDQALLRTAVEAVSLLIGRLKRRARLAPPGGRGAGL